MDLEYACRSHAAVSAVSLDHDIYEELQTVANSWAKLLSISLPSSFRGHPGLAKYYGLGNLQYILSI